MSDEIEGLTDEDYEVLAFIKKKKVRTAKILEMEAKEIAIRKEQHEPYTDEWYTRSDKDDNGIIGYKTCPKCGTPILRKKGSVCSECSAEE
jgi:hypothetical protein